MHKIDLVGQVKQKISDKSEQHLACSVLEEALNHASTMEIEGKSKYQLELELFHHLRPKFANKSASFGFLSLTFAFLLRSILWVVVRLVINALLAERVERKTGGIEGRKK